MRLESVRSLKEKLLAEGPEALRSARSGAEGVGEPVDSGPLPLPVALGIHGRDGDYRLAVRLEEETPAVLAVVDAIVEEAHGEVDVRLTGPVVALQGGGLRQTVRPLVPGCSCAHLREGRGTLGCFVTRLADPAGRPHLLSNNHVFARENFGQVDDAVLQPSRQHTGRFPDHQVAALVEAFPLQSQNNLVDAAVARITGGTAFDPTFLTGLGSLSGQRAAPLETGDTVHKVGCMTELTTGRVLAWDVSGRRVLFASGPRFFDHQIEIEPLGPASFAERGDSGSLVVDDDRLAAGLLFGGAVGAASPVFYANPLGTVFSMLRLRLLI